MIDTLPLLTPDECQDVVNRLHEARPHWTRRHPMAPFFTLGNPSYLDGGNPPSPAYLEACVGGNAFLAPLFADVYARLEETLARHFQARLARAPRTALPGFHIFLAHKAFTKPVASLHLDLQYEKISWPEDSFYSTEQPLSFTLALQLPASGGGLTWWPLDEKTVLGMPGAELKEAVRSTPAEFFPYRTGHLALHSGHLLHQISPSPKMEKGEARITLQGHGLWGRDGVLYLYW